MLKRLMTADLSKCDMCIKLTYVDQCPEAFKISQNSSANRSHKRNAWTIKGLYDGQKSN